MGKPSDSPAKKPDPGDLALCGFLFVALGYLLVVQRPLAGLGLAPSRR